MDKEKQVMYLVRLFSFFQSIFDECECGNLIFTRDQYCKKCKLKDVGIKYELSERELKK